MLFGKTMINVTKSYLPPLEEYIKYLEKIWSSGWLTNNGSFVQELETKLVSYLGVPHLHYLSNGTIALQIALRALGVSGEVITTPFTYVATTNAILWENCQPVFVDIDENTLCIDVEKIEEAITKNTKAIMATHVYGFPCDVDAISKIAKKYQLKVIYDAAHAFGCRINDSSILNYGDLSALSFHATKIFHTVEGGALVSKEINDSEIINKIRNFGHLGDEYFILGLNGKNSEFHAAMGLCVLDKIPEIIHKRKILSNCYDNELNGLDIVFQNNQDNFEYNYAYYPVLFRNELDLFKAIDNLRSNGINPRRYFFPSLNKLPFLKKDFYCPISEDISTRILCLPLYDGLNVKEVKHISYLIKQVL